MCPDKKMIAAYTDNELDEEYLEILEKHFEICPDCRAIAERQKDIKNKLKSIDNDSEITDVEKKLSNSIKNTQTAGKQAAKHFRAVPLPVFAAAAGLLVFFAAGFFIKIGEKKTKSIPTQTVEIGDTMLQEVKNYLYNSNTGTEENMTVKISEKELQQLINLLSSNSAEMEVTISLPSGPSFDIIGQPEIIRGDEYRRYQK